MITRAELDKVRDELVKELMKHSQLYVYQRGPQEMFDAAVSLLWPVIEACGNKWIVTYAERTGRGEIGESDREVFRAIVKSLSELKERVK
ncbi:MAG: hypothetical protein C4586_05785 [Anaerolineaceae bacterium]|nr:MAG: hypothetical protein C4586_05785 [Anaerolineaceae bacterium]